MTTALAFCANTRVSRIDLAGTEPIDIPQASLRAAVHRYFGPDTGSRYWFSRAKALELNSLVEAMADTLQHPAKTCPKSATDLGALRNDDICGTDASEHGRRAARDKPRDQRERADRCRLHSD